MTGIFCLKFLHIISLIKCKIKYKNELIIEKYSCKLYIFVLICLLKEVMVIEGKITIKQQEFEIAYIGN